MKLLHEWTPDDFTTHLSKLGLLAQAFQVLKIESAGEGNMNFTYRVSLSNGDTVIAKQSPPFCAKYPQIPAPCERIYAEKKYYDLVAEREILARHSPKVLAFDEGEHLLYLEDLGQASDLDTLYSFKKLEPQQGLDLVRYLSDLHACPVGSIQFSNASMRELNHAYIFALPFDEQSFTSELEQMTPGLKAVSRAVVLDPEVKKITQQMGEIYLHSRDHLIHGDYYPRSWIKTTKGLFVIDPEFGHIGSREFDLGVFLAHLMMSGQFHTGKALLEKHYQGYEKLNFENLTRFCAIEVLRRLLFVVQVPVKTEFSFRAGLVEISRLALLSGNFEELKDVDV